MNKSIVRVFSCLFVVVAINFFTSCENEIRIRANVNGVDFSYKVKTGDLFTDVLSAMEEDQEETGFNSDVISAMFENAGYERVKVISADKEGFEVKGTLPESADDPLSKAGMLSFSVEGNFITLNITRKTLTDFYKNSSQDIQNIIDMLMSPTFTDDEMTDEEYLDLISSVYGQKLADELMNSKIKFVLESPTGKVSRHTISLVTLLNLTGNIKLSA